MFKSIKHIAVFFVAFLFASTLSSKFCGADSDDEKYKRFEVSKKLMGVKFAFVVYAKNIDHARKGIIAAFERIADLEACMSDYDPDSELSQLCTKAKPGVPYKVSKDLFEVLAISHKVNQLSNGSFDPTIGPLSKIWRKARISKKVPDAGQIEKAMARVGWKNIAIDPKNKSVTFKKAGIELDLGGIAKGFAADEAINTFRKHGLPMCLVDASGDVTVGDPPPNKKGWSIAVSVKEGKRITLSNGSVASSGDRYQHLEKDGKRYSHIIDPKSGWGMTDRRLVSVITSHKKRPGTLADALASALSVYPLDKINSLAKQVNCDGIKVDQKTIKSEKTIIATGLLKN